MSRQILFGLPDISEREAILRVILARQSLSPGFDYAAIASLTENFSGSDLTELCKYGCMLPVREVIRHHRARHAAAKISVNTMRIDTLPRPVEIQVLICNWASCCC